MLVIQEDETLDSAATSKVLLVVFVKKIYFSL